MENQFEKVIDIIIAIIIFFVFPVMYFSQRQETLLEQVVSTETSDFTDNVNSHGKLTKVMYEAYISKLDDTNVIYNVKLEHKKLALEPEYRLRTAEEIIDEQDKAYTGSNTYHYFPVSTDLPVVNDISNNSGLVMNTQTNESILAQSVHTAADPTHVHTDDCYGEGNFIFTEDPNRLISPYTGAGNGTDAAHYYINLVYYSSMVGGSQYGPGDFRQFALLYFQPPGYSLENIPDKYKFFLGVPDNYFKNTSDDYLSICDDIWRNNIAKTDSNGNITNLDTVIDYILKAYRNKGYKACYFKDTPYNKYVHVLSYYNVDGSHRLISYLTLLDGDMPNRVTPDYNYKINYYYYTKGTNCHDIVKSITPTNPVQTVYVGEPLITTAKATYQDGSTSFVLCNADFVASAPVKNKTVTLSYVNIKNQTLACTETVTVIPKTKVCVNGHTYNLNSDGTDPGCPYCKAWLKNLELFNPTDGKITIYRGTTLKDNGVELLATYFDGHTEYVKDAYIDNLNKYYVGTQTVTISYKGKNVTLNVTTNRNIVQCPVCHHYYELYPDDSDPGCPYCKARTPIFTGNVLKYYPETYSNEILKELYEGTGTYYFRAGDYFSVTVSNKSETLGTKVLGFVIHGVPRTTIHVEKGGTVGEDEYGEHER